MSGRKTRSDPSAPDCDRHFSGPCRARGPGVTRSATGLREFQLRTEKLASRRSRQNPMGRDSAAPREAGDNSIIAGNYRRKRNPGYAEICQKCNLSNAQPENWSSGYGRAAAELRPSRRRRDRNPTTEEGLPRAANFSVTRPPGLRNLCLPPREESKKTGIDPRCPEFRTKIRTERSSGKPRVFV